MRNLGRTTGIVLLAGVFATNAMAGTVKAASTLYPGACAFFSGNVAVGAALLGSTGCPCKSQDPNSPQCQRTGVSISIGEIHGNTVSGRDQDGDSFTGTIIRRN